jgi:hypothetical protein
MAVIIVGMELQVYDSETGKLSRVRLDGKTQIWLRQETEKILAGSGESYPLANFIKIELEGLADKVA